jgi:hypothetical protein
MLPDAGCSLDHRCAVTAAIGSLDPFDEFIGPLTPCMSKKPPPADAWLVSQSSRADEIAVFVNQ